jgi:chorismate synthase
MASSFGQTVRVSVFGQSHSAAIGVCVDGLPAGEPVDLGRLASFMARRAPGGRPWATPRREQDAPEVLCGLNPQGRTCGAPLAMDIRNTNTRPQDYDNLRTHPRPGHADYTASVRYGGEQDPTGGGHFSGRLTAPLCAAGGVCLQVLERRGIRVGAHLSRLAQVDDARFDPVSVSAEDLAAPGAKDFPVIDDEAGRLMRERIDRARGEADSVGGVIECAAIGMPAGVGAPMFDGLENWLARALFGIPAVKGVEFGAGFAASDLRGSQDNDPFVIEGGAVRCATNNAGGINGGISNGMPLVVRVAIKPTSSIGVPQRTVDLDRGVQDELVVRGRHDPCIAPRAVPVVEAVVACVLLDALMSNPATLPAALS